uniref:PX domain-containing protein n=1 Tax=Phytophthora ramorum TaxID=164328 RepID=H3GVN5_PHYRM
MGCSHSKTSDQVVERVSVDTPAVEAPAPESIKEPEVAIEESEDLPPASASVPVEEAPKTEEPAPVEEEPAAPIEEEPAAPVEEEPAAPVEEVGEEPTENEAAEESVIPEEKPVEEEVVEAVEEAPKTEEKTPEPEETPVEAEAEAPKSEAPAEEETPKSEAPAEEETPESEAAPEAAVEEETPVKEPTAETVKIPASVVKPIDGSLTFTPEAVTFNDKGVAFYNFNGSDSSNPASDVHVSKRYSEFKALHAQLSPKVPDLPALPRASFLLGRKNKKMLDDRETQFTALLNAVAADPVASQSDAFKTFLA